MTINLRATPIQVSGLEKIREIDEGNNSTVLVIEDEKKQKFVLKFQAEAPVGALAGTHILGKVGALAPYVRTANRDDLKNIAEALKPIRAQCQYDCGVFDDARDRFEAAPSDSGNKLKIGARKNLKFKYALLMEFAEGRSLGSIIADTDVGNVKAFLKVLGEEPFGKALGKILAADAFAGNNDRMSAVLQGNQLTGWAHQENTLFTNHWQPVAIDNTFRPSVGADALPWGQRHQQGAGLEYGSVAAASASHVRLEAGVLFDIFLGLAVNKHPSLEAYMNESIRPNRDKFVEAVARGAGDAMRELLVHGQQWKKTLIAAGADAALLETFRARKRLLRQLAAGEDPGKSLSRAQNINDYHQWFLTKELKVQENAAEKLLLQGYKDFKKQMLKT